jgi:diaminopimelate epimerase
MKAVVTYACGSNSSGTAIVTKEFTGTSVSVSDENGNVFIQVDGALKFMVTQVLLVSVEIL